MMSTENKNTNTTNEEVKNEQAEMQMQLVKGQHVQEQKPEKKFNWKGLGKKILIGAGALGGAALAFGAGYLTGSHSGNSDQESAPVAADNTETSAE